MKTITVQDGKKKFHVHVHDEDKAGIQKALNTIEQAQSAVRRIKVDNRTDANHVDRALEGINDAAREISRLIG